MINKKLEKHEKMYGPHFNEACALKVVSKMHNDDGTVGQYWTLPESVQLASRYGMNVNTPSYNKYDWYVALNMVYSDFCTIIKTVPISDTTKFFVELAKHWLKDKDVDEGKMWYYYKYVMCDYYHDEEYDDIDDYEPEFTHSAMRRRPDYRYRRDMYEDDYEPTRERVLSRY